ncbi:hypothetical protein NDU88_005383 [Pleurodeles waltl]|uniref:Uncharacterized protein n=1 Tax=Pleurodeles waltl TaxID=8319 RepID=A0AAV7PID8_PLEWA|nr:hypothetical protein NDU88_005383 [Pleurodeles waltl]
MEEAPPGKQTARRDTKEKGPSSPRRPRSRPTILATTELARKQTPSGRTIVPQSTSGHKKEQAYERDGTIEKKRHQPSPEENPRARSERLEQGQQGCTLKRTGSTTCKEPQPRADTGQPEPPPHTMRDQNWNRTEETHENQGHNTSDRIKRAALPTRRKEKQWLVKAKKRGRETYNPKTKATSPVQGPEKRTTSGQCQKDKEAKP